MPHPIMFTSTERGATAIQASSPFSLAQLQGHETLFIMTPCQGMASLRHQQPRRTTTTTMTVQKHELRGKLGIGSTLGHALSIFPTSEHCNPIPPFACYKRGGRDHQPRRHNKTTPHYGNVLNTHALQHSNTPTHRDLGAIPLSMSLYPPTTSTSVQNNTSSSEHWM
jgi:hypothetical protein